MVDTGKLALIMKIFFLWSLLVFSLDASAGWEIIERVDSITDAKTVQAFSGDQRSEDRTRPGGLFFDCVPKAGRGLVACCWAHSLCTIILFF